jgi:AraC-like DNA-binding protein
LDDTYNQILFLLRGKLIFHNNHNDSFVVIKEETFLLFPHGQECNMTVEEDSHIVFVIVHNKINFCNYFPLELLYKLNESKKKEEKMNYPLEINEIISDYLNLLLKSLGEGLQCRYFYELKQQELFYYLRAYYPRKKLSDFFHPILNSDIDFSELVLRNFESAKNIADLAKITNYSVSGFKKRFMKVFGISPRDWIKEEKGKKIYYDINCTQKSFKEIAIKFDFSSPAHFSTFCKNTFGMSPSMLRESVRQNVLLEN